MVRSRLYLVFILLLAVPAAYSDDRVDFSLPDLQGNYHRLSDYRGQWVLVNYWATWCPPCREELPELEVFHSQSDGKAVVLGVNTEAIDRDELISFVEEQFLSYPILVAGPRPKPAQRLGTLRGLPTSFLVAPDGRLAAKTVGPVTADGVRQFIQQYERSH